MSEPILFGILYLYIYIYHGRPSQRISSPLSIWEGHGGGEALNVLQIPRGLTVNFPLELHNSAVHQVPSEGTFFLMDVFTHSASTTHPSASFEDYMEGIFASDS